MRNNKRGESIIFIILVMFTSVIAVVALIIAVDSNNDILELKTEIQNMDTSKSETGYSLEYRVEMLEENNATDSTVVDFVEILDARIAEIETVFDSNVDIYNKEINSIYDILNTYGETFDGEVDNIYKEININRDGVNLIIDYLD